MHRLPRLIATDLDNTLLRTDRSVSDRTVVALDAVRAAGIPVVPVTARTPTGVRAVNERPGFADWVVCGNGAYGVHLGTGESLYSVEADSASLSEVVAAVGALVPGVRFAVVRDAGDRFVAQIGYPSLASPSDHSRDPAAMEQAPVDDLVSCPALKLVFRHPAVAPADLFTQVSDAVTTCGLEMTLSGAPFVEVMGAGVSKANGLQRLCRHLGVAQQDVLAVGDGLNDIDMLQWAGRGIAVANAQAPVLDIADEITAAADDDGVAQVLERVSASATVATAGPNRPGSGPAKFRRRN